MSRTCTKCGQVMTMTPICIDCGELPIADPVLSQLKQRIAELEAMRESDVGDLFQMQTRAEHAEARALELDAMAESFNADAKKAEARMKELEADYGRWQNKIRDLVIRMSGAPKYAIDGGGCESGDPLDFTLTEIKLGFAHLDDKLRERIAELEEEHKASLARISAEVDLSVDRATGYKKKIAELETALRQANKKLTNKSRR